MRTRDLVLLEKDLIENDYYDSFFPGGFSQVIVGNILTETSGISPGKMIRIQKHHLYGVETEGATGNLAQSDEAEIKAYWLTGTASKNDFVIAFLCDYRWVALKRSSAASPPIISLPGCSCVSIPQTIYMTSLVPDCNFGVFHTCVIQYGPTLPAFYNLALGANCFLSTESFVSSYSSEAFYYLLTCNENSYSISRLFPTSIFGSPFREPPIYSWFIGNEGNTCDPFLMSNGFIFFGGDPDCDVVLSEDP